jgi:UDP-N-acetylmuramoyl-L-alanyl-D-glutamate--2,6-diaminopimelate ligase
MQFSQLLDAIKPELMQVPEQDADITAPVVEDTRAIQPGSLFVARKGPNTDSHLLIGSAVAGGAVAVVGELPPEQVDCPVPYAQVTDGQKVVGPLASAYFGYPSRQLTVVGVTGTDGKTTTTNLIYNILKAAGIRVGMISTVNAVIGDETIPIGLHVTTPPAPEVQMYLRRMVDAGLTHCVLETTSHGLAQGRVRGVDYDVAVLTNVTHEHLDFHGSFENYRAAKGLLFQSLSESFRKPGVDKISVVNLDDASAPYFLKFPADRKLTYSLDKPSEADFAAQVEMRPGEMRVDIRHRNQPFIRVRTAMVGVYNAQNILAAAAATWTLVAHPSRTIKAGIRAMPPVPGRMERIDEGQDFTAIVDFAHTPNALRRALETARQMTNGRLIAVFGSAGLRDREKRRLMAEVSAELADTSVFTAEDPRTESLDAILQAMAEGAISKGGVEGKSFYRVPDRGEAIAFACSLARPGDLVIACGKGHEQSMAFGTIEYPWDDRDAMRAALRGNPLRTLPTAK